MASVVTGPVTLAELLSLAIGKRRQPKPNVCLCGAPTPTVLYHFCCHLRCITPTLTLQTAVHPVVTHAMSLTYAKAAAFSPQL